MKGESHPNQCSFEELENQQIKTSRSIGTHRCTRENDPGHIGVEVLSGGEATERLYIPMCEALMMLERATRDAY